MSSSVAFMGRAEAQKPRSQGSITARKVFACLESFCTYDKNNHLNNIQTRLTDTNLSYSNGTILSFNTVWTDSLLFGQFENCPDCFKTVRTVSKLSRRFENCLNGLKTVRTVSKLSGWFENCPGGLQTVQMVKKLSRLFRNCLDG